MKKLLLILLCLPFIGFGQDMPTGYNEDYLRIFLDSKINLDNNEELSLLSMAYIGLGNAKLKLKLNYCKEYKRACDLGDCFAYLFVFNLSICNLMYLGALETIQNSNEYS